MHVRHWQDLTALQSGGSRRHLSRGSASGLYRSIAFDLFRPIWGLCIRKWRGHGTGLCPCASIISHAVLHVRRAKTGTPATHPIVGDEMRALRKLQREQDPKSPFVFTSERGSPFTTAGFARMVERAGVEAKLGFPAHPHMLPTTSRERERVLALLHPDVRAVVEAYMADHHGMSVKKAISATLALTADADAVIGLLALAPCAALLAKGCPSIRRPMECKPWQLMTSVHNGLFYFCMQVGLSVSSTPRALE